MSDDGVIVVASGYQDRAAAGEDGGLLEAGLKPVVFGLQPIEDQAELALPEHPIQGVGHGRRDERTAAVVGPIITSQPAGRFLALIPVRHEAACTPQTAGARIAEIPSLRRLSVRGPDSPSSRLPPSGGWSRPSADDCMHLGGGLPTN